MSYSRFISPHQRLKPVTRRPIPQIWFGLHSRGGSRGAAPNSKIVLLCGFEEKERTREALAYGVEGVILKVQPAAVALAMIEALYDRGIDSGHAEQNGSMDPQKASRQKPESEPEVSAWGDTVTEREWEVIRLVREGLSNKEIADRLCIADGTVRHHLTNIFDKLGVANRQKLLLHAHQFSSSRGWRHERSSIGQVSRKLADANCAD